MHRIEVGSGPHEENLAQVRPDGLYLDQMTRELNAWREQLGRMYTPPEGCSFKIQWSPHEFGKYGDVIAEAPDAHADWAYGAERGAAVWDDLAREELGLKADAHG